MPFCRNRFSAHFASMASHKNKDKSINFSSFLQALSSSFHLHMWYPFLGDQAQQLPCLDTQSGTDFCCSKKKSARGAECDCSEAKIFANVSEGNGVLPSVGPWYREVTRNALYDTLYVPTYAMYAIEQLLYHTVLANYETGNPTKLNSAN